MRNRLFLGLLTLSAAPGLLSPGLAAQELRGLHSYGPTGQAIAPYFEGWYANEDGTYTLSFGYFNFNSELSVYVPIGPDNRIEPAEFDGLQPEFFFAAADRERKEVGAFGITVPAEFGRSGQEIVWTLTVNGQTLSVPGRTVSEAYQLSAEGQAMGSVPPRLRLEENGPEGIGPGGVRLSETRTVAVGEPLALTVWATDPSVRQGLGVTTDVPIGLTWLPYQGAGPVTFERQADSEGEVSRLPDNQIQLPSGGGSGTMLVTFEQPGDYVLRVRADNFAADDSRFSDQCCWTNGFVPVRVTR